MKNRTGDQGEPNDAVQAGERMVLNQAGDCHDRELPKQQEANGERERILFHVVLAAFGIG